MTSRAASRAARFRERTTMGQTERSAATVIALALLAWGGVSSAAAQSSEPELDENCVVSILNRTAVPQPDGSYILPNTPSNIGRVRARATCVENGVTRSGQSDYLEIDPTSRAVRVPPIVFGQVEPVPDSLTLASPTPTLGSIGATAQLTATAAFAGGTTTDVTAADTGTTYTTSNPAIASVGPDGLVTAHAPGVVLVSAVNEGALAVLRLQIVTSGDTDGDGIPDDLEIANGLDPSNPVDGQDDPDQDGLTNREELVDLGTDPGNPDTDGDTLLDGAEGGFGTDPLLFDTDGDGLSDGLEVELGTDPLDPADFDLAGALTSIAVSPVSFGLVFNTVLGEASTQLSVTGELIDGNTLDLTARGAGFTSSDLTVCSFGAEPGRVFAGADGSCTVTATIGGFSAESTGSVSTFSPTPLSQISIPGSAQGVDVAGDLVYVAAGAAGLVVVDATDRAAPAVIATVDTPGTARDVTVAGDAAYVADGAGGLRLFDLTNPASPVLAGVLDTPGDARDVVVRGALAYVDDGNQGLRIVDVSDPTAPASVGAIGALGTLGTFNGLDVDAETGIAVVATGSSLRVIDVSVPSAPLLLGTAAVGGNAQAVVTRDGYAHVADLSRSLTVVDLTDPVNPVVGASTPRETGGLLNDVERLDDLVFGSDVFFVNGVPIVNVGDPVSPTPTAILDFRAFGDDNGTGIAADRQFVYLTTDRSRLMIGRYLSLQDVQGQPPTVNLTAPTADQTPLAGSLVEVTAEAADDVAVQRVEFLGDGQLVFTDSTRPYGFTLKVPPGTSQITLGARAVDFGNNVGVAEPVTLTVLPDLEEPVIGGFTPAPGTPFTSGDAVFLSAAVTDDVAVEEVTFQVGDRTFVDATAPYEVTTSAPPVFVTTDLPIRIEAVDPSGNRATLDFTVPVEPIQDTLPPEPRFLSPGDGDGVLPGAEVTVALEIADDHFIDGYVLTLDGQTIGARSFIEQPFFEDQVVLTVPAEAAPGQTFTLELTASDFGGNVGVAQAAMVVVGGTVLTGDHTLDSSFDGQDLVLGAGTFTVVEPLAPSALNLLGGARVVGAAGETLRLAVQGELRVGGGASIDVSGLGFPGSGASGSVNGGAPAGLSPSTQDAGGSHGGTGNAWDSGSAGEVYDSVYVPQLGGGGGARDQDGVDQGLPGGGVLEITAGAVTVNGEVLARGLGDASNRAGGAGGTILIETPLLLGAGRLDASGGSTAPCCTSHRTGAGGGGRIAVYAGALDRFDPATQALAQGGARRDTNGAANGYAAPGTVFVHRTGSVFGDLRIDSGEDDSGNDRNGPATELPFLGSGEVLTFDTEDLDAWVGAAEPFQARFLGAFLRLFDAGGTDLGLFRVSDLDGAGRARLTGAGATAAAATFRGEYRFDTVVLANSAGLTGETPIETDVFRIAAGVSGLPSAPVTRDLVIEAGARATLAEGGHFQGTVTGTLTIEAGGSLDLSGRGFPGSGASGTVNGGAPAGLSPSTQDAGGSHGGVGTIWDSGSPGEVFDSVYLPQLGGGGGARDQDGVDQGLPGGGVIELAVGDLILDGEILARGLGDASNRAGGAGGSVLITATTLSGTGLIDVSGGSTLPCCTSHRTGSGGGGRVALYADELQGFDPVLQVRAHGGARRDTNGAANGYAAPGTVFVHTAASTYGDLLIDAGEDAGGNDQTGPSTELPSLGTGAVTAFEVAGADALLAGAAPFRPRLEGAFVRLLDAAGGDLGAFRVARVEADGRLLLDGAGAVAGAATYQGEYRFDAVELRNGADVLVRDPVEGFDVIVLPGDSQLPASFLVTNLTIQDGARVGVAEGGTLRGTVTGTLTIEAGGSLDLSGRGFPGSGASGTVNGGAPAGLSPSTQDAGGSHGGVGTIWDSGSPGEVFDSVYLPQLGGGGGARDQDGVDQGLPGGGVIELAVGDLILDGEILARGLGDASNRAGGAGGSVLITATTLSGTGLIDVSGGSTLPCCTSHRTGSGGGGRVALYADELQGFDPVLQVRAHGGARRDTNGAANAYAGPGTILVTTAASTFGDLIVDQGDPGGLPVAQTPLPAVGSGIMGATAPDTEDPAALWIEPQDPGGLFALGVSGAYVRVDGLDYRVLAQTTDRRQLLLEGANGLVNAGDSYLGVYKLDIVTVRGGATLVFFDEPDVGLFDVAPDSQVIDNSPP
jgi:hypothetical protein